MGKSIYRPIDLSIYLTALCVIAIGPIVQARQAAQVTGTITYRERMALSPTAVVDVRLDDVTRPGAAEPVVSSTRIDRPGQVPIRFELPYDPRSIDQRGRYAVRAVISDQGVVMFASLDTALVLTQGKGPKADLVLTRLPGTPPPPPQAKPAAEPPAPPLPPMPLQNLPATFTGTLPCADCEGIRYHLNLFPDDSYFLRMTYVGRQADPVDDIGSWAVSSDRRVLVLKGKADKPELFAIPGGGTLRKLDIDGQPMQSKTPNELTRTSEFRALEVRLPVRGMYVKAGNTGAFVDCSTGQLWQVPATGKAVAELDGAYAAAKPSPGTALLAEVEGVVSLHPRTDAVGLRDTLTVQRFVRVQRGQSCPARFSSAPLAGTFWRLTNLGGRAVPAVSDSRRQPSITFTAPVGRTPGQYSGSTGCNRVIGTYSAVNATLSLAGGGTMRACKEDAVAEAALLAALKNTRTYRIAGNVLELYDESGARLARFEG
jgi:uncharacterized lipoprotein YbaY/uncharacterized lipoprotein NlpE involved in copper resistance/heat shock protein HslJ